MRVLLDRGVDGAAVAFAGDTHIDITCGVNAAVMYLGPRVTAASGAGKDRTRDRRVLFDGAWLTPNEFQTVSGRGTADSNVGVAQDPTGGAYSAPADPLAVFGGLILKGGEGMVGEGSGEERRPQGSGGDCPAR